jgi:hypothetical protein
VVTGGGLYYYFEQEKAKIKEKKRELLSLQRIVSPR